MSVMNDDFIGDEQSPARANALGDLEDASVSAHFPLHHNGGHEFKTTKENLKLKCPRRECKEVCHTREELDKHQWKKCHYRCVTCEMDFPDEDTQFVHNSKVRCYSYFSHPEHPRVWQKIELRYIHLPQLNLHILTSIFNTSFHTQATLSKSHLLRT